MRRLKKSETFFGQLFAERAYDSDASDTSPCRALFRIKFADLDTLNERLPFGGAEVKYVPGILRISHCDEAILGSHFHASAGRRRTIRRFHKISVGELWT
jgi:hypothetical protein